LGVKGCFARARGDVFLRAETHGFPQLLWFALSEMSIKGALGGPFVVQ
jgi:hypothetical protein